MSAHLLETLARAPGTAAVVAALQDEPGVWVVGGAIRDVMLGREPAELDVVVEHDAAGVAGRVAARLGGDVRRHERFGTATVRAPGGAFDVAATRRESYCRPGALPDVQLGAPLADDLARRDFTVNTLALRLADGVLRSSPGAREDLDARVLRVLHDGSFRDDPTRLLRLARYAARLGFAVEERTASLAGEAVAAGALDTVSGERLGAELLRLAREPQPAALIALERFGVGAALLPGLVVDPARIARALAVRPGDARSDLVALAVAGAGVAPGRWRELGLTAPEAAAVEAASLLPARMDGPPSEIDALLRRLPPEAAAVAAADSEPARAWLAGGRSLRLAITGSDLLAAGLSGQAVGHGLAAARAALLDGRAPDRDAQLAVALSATDPAS